MAVTLVALFIFTHFYRKKEVQISKLEVDYYEKALALKQDPKNQQLRESTLQAAQSFANAKGLDEKAFQSMISNDLN